MHHLGSFYGRALVLSFGLLAPAAHAEDPFVLVSTQGSIYKFDLEGNSLGVAVDASEFGMNQPQHMAIGPDGHLYVAQWQGGIEVYDLETGSHVRTVARQGVGGATNNAHLTIRGDTLMVGSFGSDRVLQYDLSDNDRQIEDFAPPGTNLVDPHGMSFLDNGDVLVMTLDRVSRYSAEGDFLGVFSFTGIAQGTDSEVYGDRLIVSNFNGPTQQFDLATGQSLGLFNLDGRGAGGDGVAVMPDGSVLLAFNTTGIVRRYDASGNLIGGFANRLELESSGPNGILVVPAPGALTPVACLLLAAARRRR